MKFVLHLKSYLLRSSTSLTASTLHSPSHMNLDDLMLSIKISMFARSSIIFVYIDCHFAFPHQMGIVLHYVVG